MLDAAVADPPKTEETVLGLETLSDSVESDYLSEQNKATWSRVIQQISEWTSDPESFRDRVEGIEPATSAAIDASLDVIDMLFEVSFPAPLRVVLNGEGGLVFEWRHNECFTAIEVLADGSDAEGRQFVDAKLVYRFSLSIPQSD